jgi:hypothetical protein
MGFLFFFRRYYMVYNETTKGGYTHDLSEAYCGQDPASQDQGQHQETSVSNRDYLST